MAGIIQLLKYRLSRDPARFDDLAAFFDLAQDRWRDDLAAGQTETLRLERGGKENSALWSRVFFAELITPLATELEALPDINSNDAQNLLTQIYARWCATVPSQAAIARLTTLARVAKNGPRKQALAQAAMHREAILNQGLGWTRRTPEKKAEQRLKQDWAKSPPLRSFIDEHGIDFVSLGAWVATLDRDTLHVFASNYSFEHGNLTPLHAAMSNPACDKATALSLLARCDPASFPQAPRKGRKAASKEDGEVKALIEAIHTRLISGVFSPSSLAPAPEVAMLRDWQLKRLKAEQALRWVLGVDMFEDLGTARPDPAYDVANGGLEFRTPFRKGIVAA